ncbi:MAG: response regulator, partial [Alphaproteobacteria bacterium]|nr:response regulator [Alphaproteobacteria bacterium]
NRIKKIVDDLRNYAKKDEGFLTDDVDINLVINNAFRLVESQTRRMAHVKLQLADKLPVFKGNFQKLEQVIVNMILNAAQSINGQKGKVVITSSGSDGGEYVEVKISDNGNAIPHEVLDNIFDPFFTTKGQGKGSGLGLSVVYGLVNELGGHLDVETKLDKGTTMSVYLPRYVGVKPKKEILGDIDQPETIRLDGYTILVAEDEPDLCEVVVSMLEDLGLKVLSAPNGTDALVCQDDYDGKIDVLLTDVLMPEVNGVKLAELLMSLRPDTKVIFMSGFPARGDMAPVELPKDAVFIAKPMIYEKLAQMLCHTLSDEKHSTEGVINDVVDMARWKHSDKIMGGDA